MRIGERSHDVPGDNDGPEGDAFMHHRDGEYAAIAYRRGCRTRVLRVLGDVWHVDHCTHQDCASTERSTDGRPRICLPYRGESLGIDVVLRCKVHELPIKADH